MTTRPLARSSMMGTEHDDVRPGGARIPHPVTVPQAGRDSARAMDIQLGSERIFVLRERDSEDQFRQQAMDHRSQSFGSGLGSLLQRPKAEDIVLLNSPASAGAARARREHRREGRPGSPRQIVLSDTVRRHQRIPASLSPRLSSACAPGPGTGGRRSWRRPDLDGPRPSTRHRAAHRPTPAPAAPRPARSPA